MLFVSADLCGNQHIDLEQIDSMLREKDCHALSARSHVTGAKRCVVAPILTSTTGTSLVVGIETRLDPVFLLHPGQPDGH